MWLYVEMSLSVEPVSLKMILMTGKICHRMFVRCMLTSRSVVAEWLVICFNMFVVTWSEEASISFIS